MKSAAEALKKGVTGVQFLFLAVGSTVLMPLLVGMDPSTALFTAGVGTLIFHAVTGGACRFSWAAVSRTWPPSSR